MIGGTIHGINADNTVRMERSAELAYAQYLLFGLYNVGSADVGGQGENGKLPGDLVFGSDSAQVCSWLRKQDI